jgi:hypothetical protein
MPYHNTHTFLKSASTLELAALGRLPEDTLQAHKSGRASIGSTSTLTGYWIHSCDRSRLRIGRSSTRTWEQIPPHRHYPSKVF